MTYDEATTALCELRSDAERAELQRETVERIKAGTMSRSRVAARYAALVPCSLTDAAVVFDLARSSVRDAWHRAYPGVPGLLSRRRR